jgi:hypothetical protein
MKNIKIMTRKERELRIIARGETSNHSHVVIGDDVNVITKENKTIIEVGKSGAVLRHLLEDNWVNEGVETWTEEHTDIKIEKGRYEYIQQVEYDPLAKLIQKVKD